MTYAEYKVTLGMLNKQVQEYHLTLKITAGKSIKQQQQQQQNQNMVSLAFGELSCDQTVNVEDHG